MKRIVLIFMAAIASAQSPDDDSMVFGYSGTDLTYICYARSVATTGYRASTFVSISGVSKATAAVVTSAAHGFPAGSRPSVTISGATGTGWTAINAAFTATVTGVDTFTIPVNSTGFGTLGGTVVFKTTAPRTVMPEWKIKKFVYTAGVLDWSGWQVAPSYSQTCSTASAATTNQQ
jgi:hypothetical protein